MPTSKIKMRGNLSWVQGAKNVGVISKGSWFGCWWNLSLIKRKFSVLYSCIYKQREVINRVKNLKKNSMSKVFHFPPVFFYFLLSELLFNDQSAVKPIVYSIFCMTGPMILNISAISEWLDKWTHAPKIRFFFHITW